MEILGERPAWAMSGSEKLSTLDAVVAERARLKVVELQLIAELERDGDAQQIGAGDTARLLAERYRLDLPTARRTVRTATGLTKHPATAAALPDPATPFPNPATARPDTDRTDTDRTDADRPDADRPDADGPDADLPDADGPDADRPDEADGAGAGLRESGGWRVYPAQAEAILSVLAKIPTTVPVENVEFAEQQLITLAATHTPSELRAAGKKIRDLLDPDGPEPDEKLAYSRESLTWKNADQGVTFRGYLACENAELFRTLIHAGARPHKTVDGEPDPRPRSKRQADALTTALNTAASTSTSTTTVTTTAATPATPATPAATTTAAATTATAATATATTAGAGAGARPGARAEAGGRGQSEPSAPPDGSDAPTPTEPIALLEPAQDPLPDVDTADALATARSEPADGTDGPGGAGGAGGASGSGAGGPVADQPPAADARGRADADIGAAASIVAGHGAKPHISVTIDYNDLKTAAANATGELVFGDTLSAATLRRLACDAEILPIVLGSKSQPLDVGTSQRLVTRPMRRALNARDKGCVVCGAPPIQCEAHHLKHWIDGGITAVSNLVLLCKRHHLDLHSGHWQIRITDGIVHVTRPTWADPTHIPRNRYRPPLITDQPPTSPPTSTVTSPVTSLAIGPGRTGSDRAGVDRAGCDRSESQRFGVNGADSNGADRGANRAANRRPAVVDPACPDPWGDEHDINPQPNTRLAAAPPIPWADDPPPPRGPATTDASWTVAAGAGKGAAFDPWGDDPLPDPVVGVADQAQSITTETSETGVTEVGVTEVGVTEVGVTEVGVTEAGATEAGATETGATETGVTETGVTETGGTETGGTETGAKEAASFGARGDGVAAGSGVMRSGGELWSTADGALGTVA